MKTILKLLFTIGALYYVFSQIDYEKTFVLLKEVNIFYILIAFLIFNISQFVSAFRLEYILSLIGINLDTKFNLKLYYVGMFYNIFLPGGIAGDGYKVYIINKKTSKPIKKILKSFLVDRGSGLSAVLFLAGILFLFSDYKNFYLSVVDIILIVMLFFVFYFIIKFIFKEFLSGIIKYSYYSLFVQILQLVSAFFIIFSFAGDYIVDFLFLFLVSSIVAVIPISIGGVGLREMTFLYGLKFIDVSPEKGVLFSMLFFLITMISSLIGLAFIKNTN